MREVEDLEVEDNGEYVCAVLVAEACWAAIGSEKAAGADFDVVKLAVFLCD